MVRSFSALFAPFRSIVTRAMSSSATDAMPAWRANLLAIPPPRRSRFQRDLVRSLKLADQLELDIDTHESFYSDDPSDSSVFKCLLLGVEATLLGPGVLSPLNTVNLSLKEPLTMLALMYSIPCYTTGPLPVRVGAALSLVLILYRSIVPGKTPPDFIKSLMEEMLPWAFEFLEGPEKVEIDELLSAAGSRLSADTLCSVLRLQQAEFRLMFPCNLAAVKSIAADAAPAIMAIDLKAAPAFFADKVANLGIILIEPFMDALPRTAYGVVMGSRQAKELATVLETAFSPIIDVLERAVAVAEAAGDVGMLALCAGMLLRLLVEGMQEVEVSELSVLKAKAVEAAEPWLPRAHRHFIRGQCSFDHAIRVKGGSMVVGKALHCLRSGPPRSDRTHRNVGKVNASYGMLPALRRCSGCGTRSSECKICSGCTQAYYCFFNCQVRWGGGASGASKMGRF